MSKKHDQQYYMKQCHKVLMSIKDLGPNEGALFLRLKKKAAKYLEKAKQATGK